MKILIILPILILVGMMPNLRQVVISDMPATPTTTYNEPSTTAPDPLQGLGRLFNPSGIWFWLLAGGIGLFVALLYIK